MIVLEIKRQYIWQFSRYTCCFPSTFSAAVLCQCSLSHLPKKENKMGVCTCIEIVLIFGVLISWHTKNWFLTFLADFLLACNYYLNFFKHLCTGKVGPNALCGIYRRPWEISSYVCQHSWGTGPFPLQVHSSWFSAQVNWSS